MHATLSHTCLIPTIFPLHCFGLNSILFTAQRLQADCCLPVQHIGLGSIGRVRQCCGRCPRSFSGGRVPEILSLPHQRLQIPNVFTSKVLQLVLSVSYIRHCCTRFLGRDLSLIILPSPLKPALHGSRKSFSILRFSASGMQYFPITFSSRSIR